MKIMKLAPHKNYPPYSATLNVLSTILLQPGELSLAVGSQIDIAKILTDLNLAARNRITIHIIYARSKKFWWILI